MQSNNNMSGYKKRNIRILLCIAIIILDIILLNSCVLNKDNDGNLILTEENLNIKLTDVEKINGAKESKSPVYKDNSITFEFVLPEDDSSIKYTITIKNDSDISKLLSDLVIEKINNPDIEFEIIGLTGNEVLKPGEEKTIQIIFKNKEKGSDTVNKVVLSYDLTDLEKDGDATIEVSSTKENGAKEKEKPVVSKDSIILEFVLPEKDSTIKYTITIKNNTDTNKTIKELVVEKISNPNVEFEIIGVDENEILKPGEEKEVQIIFKNKGEGSSEVIKVEIKYELKDVYVITYNLNGGTADIKTQIKEKDKTINISNVEPQKNGYIFKGYSVTENGKVSYKAGAEYKENEDLNLYAKYEPIKYSVTYIGNGNTSGSMDDSTHTYDKTKKLNENKFIKKGHKFIGWSLDVNGTKVYNNSQSVVNLSAANGSKINLYAVWERNKYTLNVKIDGGNLNGVTEDFKKELMYEEQYFLSSPVKTGYTFNGWLLSETGSIMNSINGNVTITMGDSNMTVTANYNPNTYEITLENDADVLSGTTNLYLKYDRGVFLDKSQNNLMSESNNPIVVPKRDGYLFNGYYVTVNDKEIKVIDKNGYITESFKNNLFTSDSVIYAKWRTDAFVINLDNQNAGDESTKQIFVKYDENFYLDSNKENQMSSVSNPIVVPEREGYTFKGYYTKPNGEGDMVVSEKGFIVETANKLFNDDATIYANYVSNVYKITLNDTNTKIYSKYETGLYLDEAFTKEMTESSNAVSVTSNVGYIFKGYYTKPNGEGSLMIDSNGFVTSNFTSKTFLQDTTLYAYQTPISYVVKYESNGATSGTMSDSIYTYGEKSNLRKNSYARLGYTFMGWSISSENNTVTYEDGAEILNLSDRNNSEIILYAVWSVNEYTLMVDLNGGSLEGLELSQKVSYGSQIRLGTPTKEGYTFKKWNVTGDGSVINDETNTLTVGNGNVSVVAEYESSIYEITLNNNGATEVGTSKIYAKYDEGIYLDKELENELSGEKKIEVPTKTGYAFLGYYSQDDILMINTEGKITSDFTNTYYKDNASLIAKWSVNTYTVTFMNEGNQYGEVQTIEYNGNITVPTTPTKEGYTFKHWSKEENGQAYDLSTVVTKNVTLYAVYEINTYTVTFMNDGTQYGEVQTIEYDGTIVTPENPSKEGYTFKYWCLNENGETAYDLSTTVTDNVTLYAVYEINTYTVTFMNDGEAYGEVQTIEYGGTIVTPENPIKRYYTFKYWSTSENGEKYDLSTVVNDNVTLYAVYEINAYTVTLVDKGEQISSETVEAGTLITVPTVEKEGYTFSHWSLTENGEAYDLLLPVESNVTLYSVYNINQYNVEFYDKDSNIKTLKVDWNNKVSNSDIPSVTPEEGYSFIGWYEDGAAEAFDFETNIKSNKKLYSKYEKIENGVIFNDENRIETVNVEYGNKVTAIASKGKEGYTFKHWSLSVDGEAFNFDTAINETITLYAVYEINAYTVTFMSDGAVYGDIQTINYNSNIVAPTEPTKTGHTFKHWSLTENGEAYDINTPVTGNITLYAVYEINTYTVTFINGTTQYGEVQTINYGGTIVAPENPTKTGYTFSHWSLTENGEAYDLTTIVTSSITLYSVYTINTYTVTFMSDGAMYGEVQTIDYNGSITEPTSPQKAGYTFKHWSKAEGGISYSLATPVTENITLYAVYSINTYVLTIDPNGGLWNGETDTQTFDIVYNDTKEIPVPTKEGYTFTGWTKEGNGSMSSLSENATFTMGTESTTLTANYEINAYTLTVNPNGGTWNGESSTQVFDIDYQGTKDIPVPTKEGYTFTGWTKEGNGSMSSLSENATFTMGTESTTLTANYEINAYTLTVNPNGGTWNGESSTQVFDIDYQGTKDIPVPTKEGYTFTGWTKEGNGSMSSLTETAVFTMSTEDTTLSANYESNTYEITLDNKGANVSGTTKIYEKYEQGLYIDSGLTTQITKIEVPEKTGYTFNGYYTEEDSNGTMLIDQDGNITGNLANDTYKENVTIYAGYTLNEYSLTINYNDSVTSAEVHMLDYNETKEITVPTREGYEFTGWSLTGEGSTMSSLTGDAIFTMGTETATLNASWSPITYQVQYDGNNSTSGSMTNSTHTYDVAKTLTTNTYVKNGYTFKGWATSDSATEAAYTDSESVTNLTSTNNAIVTLYAVWEINTYTLTVDPNTGSWNDSTESQTFDLDYNSTKTIAEPTKEGFTFSGWTVTGTGSSVTGTTFTMGYENTTIKANYNPNKYEITLDGDSATTTGTTTIYEEYSTGIYLDDTYTKVMTISTNAITIPTKTGYAFGGYYTEKEGAGTQMITAEGYITSSLTSTTYLENTTLYAKWTRITASDLYYDNSTSGLSSTNVQDAIDEINEMLGE